jgi:hypothetical protein
MVTDKVTDKLMGYQKLLLLKNTIAAPSPGAFKLPFGSDLETEAAVLSLARTFFQQPDLILSSGGL